MNTWLQFLTQHNAQIGDTGEVAGYSGIGMPGELPSGFVAPLTDLGLIAVSGEEAANFLHNQLTNDVEQLQTSEARLAGYCSAKGRLLATFLMWKTADAIMLQLPRQIQPAVQKRLQMFVLRTKAKLVDAADDHVALGLGGAGASEALGKWFPTLPGTPYAKVDAQAGTLIRLPDSCGMPRYQWITSVDTAKGAWPDLASALAPVATQIWRLTEIHAGIPQITQATQEQFVPQMVNFELIGGVNFRKGCYPGQEIVARSQYLGKLKRRTMLAAIDAPDVKAGTDVFSSADPGQPCGMIVNAAANFRGGSDCLVEVKVASMTDGTIHLGAPGGAMLKFESLPYPLTDAA